MSCALCGGRGHHAAGCPAGTDRLSPTLSATSGDAVTVEAGGAQAAAVARAFAEAGLEDEPAAFREPEQLRPGDRVGEYEVTGKLGQGGMGAVYSAVHPVIGKRVAIKVLRQELSRDERMVARFVQEARAVNRIGHKNIVDIFGFGRLPSGLHYCVMEHLEGRSLQQRIDQGPLPLGDALDVALGVCDALAAAHAARILHRDLKPDNIFLVDAHGERTVKLLDFGIAKLLQPDPELPSSTRTGAQVGTPLYMSPEQCAGTPVDPRSDLYALGVVLFELVCGRPPFQGRVYDVIHAHLNAASPRPSQFATLPPALERLILRCLEKVPEARPATVDEVKAALVAIRAALTPGEAGATAPERAPADPAPARARPAASRSRWRIVAGVASAVAAAAVAVVALGGPLAGAPSPSLSPVIVVPPPAPPGPAAAPAAPPAAVEVRPGGQALAAPPPPRGGHLVVVTRARSATWSLDGQPLAERGGRLDLPELAPGPHLVAVEARGYRSRRERVDVAAGQLASFEWSLTPAAGPQRARHGGGEPPLDENATSGWPRR